MKERFLPYNHNLKQFSRNLRKESTLSEVLLWDKIKNRQMRGYQFLRQKPLDNYIADFYCQKLNLVLEVDGYSHSSAVAVEYDQCRDAVLSAYQLATLRIEDKDVKRNIQAVLRMIEDYIDEFERLTAAGASDQSPGLRPPPF